MIKAIIIILVVLIYWTIVYYRFHYKPYTPISLIAGGFILGVIGLYGLFNGNVTFFDISLIYYIIIGFYVISHILIYLGAMKHGLIPGVDITLNWIKQRFGMWAVYLGCLIIYPLIFFVIAGTYLLLGKEQVYFWGLIIIAWTISNIKLLVRYVLR